jgi:hypothetical protein
MSNTPKQATATDAHKRFCGVEGRSGPGKGNANAMRHGLKAGKLPKDARYIEHQMNALRRQLENAVFDAKGAVGLVDAANIQTAVKWERHGALCLRWLRLEGSTMKPEQRLQFSREIARASAERDKAIAALELGKEGRLPWLAPPALIENTSEADANHDRQ